MDPQTQDFTVYDKVMDNLFEIYSRVDLATPRRLSSTKSNQGTAGEIQLPVPQRFVKKQKHVSTHQKAEPLPTCSIDSSSPLLIKDSYDAVLATFMNINT